VRQKLAPIASEFVGRNVLLVDDSIVRGTTCGEIVQMAREAGAKSVCIASAAPPVRFPNVYGIDMPTKDELVAHRTHSEAPQDLERKVAMAVGADRVIYQQLPDLEASIHEEAAECGSSLGGLDSSCFNGHYVTEQAVSADYLKTLARTRAMNRGADAKDSHLLDQLEIPSKAARVR